ncbi:2-methylcitrate synthase [Pseudovibrio axinellae]|uniref:citrate synthase (unknown stereospecificity) n=1 Tax=Pseudovibrio axinellae TaxID=989403 RepID=A0A166A4U2_9HYPH|nr:citrate synthase family protein [Pseudovibrio axinellae]KZL20623.1 2-methylcitrate synthase [Pseudovibrio axinellae]SER27599.1 citrate synthase [Pseudovibrio axinellae]
MSEVIYLSAKEAANELGVRPATLYAYVSRGLVRSVQGPGRTRLYDASDIRFLRSRRVGEGTEAHEGQSRNAAAKGVLETKLTLLTDEGHYYRGQSALELAKAGTLESVSTLLWECESDPFSQPTPKAVSVLSADQRPVERAIVALCSWPEQDNAAYTLSQELLKVKGAGLLRLAASALLLQPPSSEPMHRQIARAWGVKNEKAIDLIRATLVLCADHELNTSAYAVRCAASTRAPLHAVLISGLGAFMGPRHGTNAGRVLSWLKHIHVIDDIENVLQERCMNGEYLPGLGHSVYGGPDPRGEFMLKMLIQSDLDHPLIELIPPLLERSRELFGKHMNVDFPLALLVQVLGLPTHSAGILFCISRISGWIAQALEQYQMQEQIRPRAAYVGIRPA